MDATRKIAALYLLDAPLSSEDRTRIYGTRWLFVKQKTQL